MALTEQHKKYLAGGAGVILLILAAFFGFSGDPVIDPTPTPLPSSDAGGAAWWNYSWDYRQEITLNRSAGTVGTNYVIELAITYDANMSANFEDLRFIDDDDTTELEYWFETNTTSTDAIVWVEVLDEITTTNVSIWMYYGNASEVSTTSDGFNTFILFDDFDDAELNASVWVNFTRPTALVNETGGYLETYCTSSVFAGSGVTSVATFPNTTDYAIETLAKKTNYYLSTPGHVTGFTDKGNWQGTNYYYWDGNNSQGRLHHYLALGSGPTADYGAAKGDQPYTLAWVNQWVRQSVYTLHSNKSTLVDYEWSGTATYRVNSGAWTYEIDDPNYLQLASTCYHLIGYGYWDWVAVRPIGIPEPVYSFGAEEEPSSFTVGLNPATGATSLKFNRSIYETSWTEAQAEGQNSTDGILLVTVTTPEGVMCKLAANTSCSVFLYINDYYNYSDSVNLTDAYQTVNVSMEAGTWDLWMWQDAVNSTCSESFSLQCVVDA